MFLNRAFLSATGMVCHCLKVYDRFFERLYELQTLGNTGNLTSVYAESGEIKEYITKDKHGEWVVSTM